MLVPFITLRLHVIALPFIIAGSCNLKNILPLCCSSNQAFRKLCVSDASVKGRSRRIE